MTGLDKVRFMILHATVSWLDKVSFMILFATVSWLDKVTYPVLETSASEGVKIADIFNRHFDASNSWPLQ